MGTAAPMDDKPGPIEITAPIDTPAPLGEKPPPDGGKQAAAVEIPPPGVERSALCVAEALGIPHRKDMPGHLYICKSPKYPGPVPLHQEKARQQFEDFSSVLRIALQDSDPPRFAEFFYRLLTLAQATFDPSGFNDGALNDLPTFRREVVQVAGAAI